MWSFAACFMWTLFYADIWEVGGSALQHRNGALPCLRDLLPLTFLLLPLIGHFLLPSSFILLYSCCPSVPLLSFPLPPLALIPAGRHILPRSSHPCSPSKSLLSWLCFYPTQQEFSFKRRKGRGESVQLPLSWQNASPGIFPHCHQQPSLALSPTPPCLPSSHPSPPNTGRSSHFLCSVL